VLKNIEVIFVERIDESLEQTLTPAKDGEGAACPPVQKAEPSLAPEAVA
jgi:hypothetical protein